MRLITDRLWLIYRRIYEKNKRTYAGGI